MLTVGTAVELVMVVLARAVQPLGSRGGYRIDVVGGDNQRITAAGLARTERITGQPPP